MKHINLSPLNDNGLATYMVSQESNNFGDQILTLKVLKRRVETLDGRFVNTYGYEILAITSRGEGDWMQIKDMKNWLKNVLKIGVSSETV